LTAHYFYWFIGAGITTPSHASRSIITLKDNLIHNINHRWAYVSVLALNTEGLPMDEIRQRPRNDTQTTELITEVIANIAPYIHKEMNPEFQDQAQNQTAH